jgi:hypothetical protein
MRSSCYFLPIKHLIMYVADEIALRYECTSDDGWLGH